MDIISSSDISHCVASNSIVGMPSPVRTIDGKTASILENDVTLTVGDNTASTLENGITWTVEDRPKPKKTLMLR